MKTVVQSFLLLCALLGLQELGAQDPSISYAIGIDEQNPHLARVSIAMIPQDSLLYMPQGAGQFPRGWAQFVHHLEVVDAQGTPITVTELPDARWAMAYTPKERIQVHYEVHLEHHKHEWGGGLDGVAYATDWGVFYTGRALLVLNGEAREQIPVSFELPPTWKVTTPWKRTDKGQHRFVAANQSALSLGMFFAGTHEELSFKREGFELLFALGGSSVQSNKEEYQHMASGVLDYYIDLMGGLPNPPPDNVLDRSVVIINEADQTDGEVIGNNISILIQKDADDMSKMISRFIFAHEFFHLWNAKSMVPEDQETEWFKEGFTNYYTLKALYHVGLLNDTAYFGALNNLFFQRYTTDDGVGRLSMTQGQEKHAHWGLIYGGGLFVAIAQDMMIRETSDNKKSLDDLMTGLFKKYGGTHERYTIDELQERLEALNGKDQSDFFTTYIRGTERIPIDQYLSKAGLDAKITDDQLKIAKKETPTPLQEAMIKGMLGLLDNQQ